VRLLVSNSIYARKDKNGPTSANQVASRDKPRCGYAVYLWVHPSTSSYPDLSAEAEPISKGRNWKSHHEAESLMTYIRYGPYRVN